MIRDGFVAIGGFGDLWLHSGREHKFRPRGRELRPDLVRNYACAVCGAGKGEFCTRQTVSGRIQRRLPHFGRDPNPGRNYAPGVRGA